MAEWLGHQTCNLEVPASSPVLTAHRHHHHLSLCQKVHKAMQCSYQTVASPGILFWNSLGLESPGKN